jgi:hypothetical protein
LSKYTGTVHPESLAQFIRNKQITASLGNIDPLKQPKTAFLCSRKVPASVVLKCYDWAIEQREKIYE